MESKKTTKVQGDVYDSILARNALKIEYLDNYVKEHMVNRPYHNYQHAIEAAQRFQEIGEAENLSPEALFVGRSAMIVHDLISVPGAKDNEERTIEQVVQLLPGWGYGPSEVRNIYQIIYATKVGVEPESLLEQIAKDSDLDNLGTDKFFEKTEALRKEFGVADPLAWYNGTLGFLNSHRYYTSFAKQTRNAGLKYNIEQVQKRIAELTP